MADPSSDLEQDAKRRLEACRIWKDLWQIDFAECYFFCSPNRLRQISSRSQPAAQRFLDAPELNTDQAFIVVGDFVTELVNTYMPEAQIWCEFNKGSDIPQEVWDQYADQFKAQTKTIFEAIKASNFYSELPKAFYPDIAIGTSAMWIDRKSPQHPIEVKAVPIHELEINLGPNGEVDDRWVVRYVRNSAVRGVLGDELFDRIPRKAIDEAGNLPHQRTELRWGFWRKWEKVDECWQHVIMYKNDIIHEAELVGEGSCPLIVMRFNPAADWPWGLGPMIMGLPSFRQIDELEYQRVKHTELSLTPPIGFPDDSFASVEQGLEPGMAYPIRPGSEGAIKPIYTVPSPEEGAYTYEEKLKQLRKLFYVDFPEQSGDTPPTLGQWLDEMARAQRRIGTPGMSFWREGPCKIFLRYKTILERFRIIEPIKVNGGLVAAVPYNPAQRAAEQQEIATAVQFAQIGAQMFPEEWKMVVDGQKTMKAFIDKMRVSGLIKFRDPADIQKAVQQMAQLAQGQAAGAPAGAATNGAGVPGPVP